MNKKLQIFVSSTYTDLIEERQAAVEGILRAGHIPAGMELFTAGDKAQWEIIQRWIDESDVFILLLGGRYGSREPVTNKSYIHLEYEYAESNNKPILTFFLSDAAINRMQAVYGLAMDVNQTEYQAFKEKALSRMCRPVEDAKDIKMEVMAALHASSQNTGLVGWVPGSEYECLLLKYNELKDCGAESDEEPPLTGSSANGYQKYGMDKYGNIWFDEDSIVHKNGRSEEVICTEWPSTPMISPDRRRILYISPFEWEVLGSVYIYNVALGYVSMIINVNDLQFHYKPHFVNWITDRYVAVIIGNGYGTCTKGGALWCYDCKTDSFFQVLKPEGTVEVISVDRLLQNRISVKYATWDDNKLNYTTHADIFEKAAILDMITSAQRGAAYVHEA